MKICVRWLVIALLGTLLLSVVPLHAQDPYRFTEADLKFLKQFSLSRLPELPKSPGNVIADDLAAAKLGQQLFFDKRLSGNGQVSCATCHQPERYFTDGKALSVALGTTRRSAPSLLGAAWSPWLFWDGRKDSLWSQALGPLENPVEHGTTRNAVAQNMLRSYLPDYEAIFGKVNNVSELLSLPEDASPIGSQTAQNNWLTMTAAQKEQMSQIFANSGKLLMAYQRRLMMTPAPFDQFVELLNEGKTQEAKTKITESQVRGLRLFVGKANCASCHNGPLFTNFEFHNVGAPESNLVKVDLGRYEGVKALVKDEFTCLSKWSDAPKESCEEMLFLKTKGKELIGAFKTPTLRNIVHTAPYMQTGQFADLKQVMQHYNVPTPPYYDRSQHPERPHFDILPLLLTEQEIDDVIAFLGSLTSPIKDTDEWWRDPNNLSTKEVAQKNNKNQTH
ncbi:cytochrome-c peroxidase [Pleionea sp. CnH1-48]|uniref:cytochrome-c peroxidase n=1 Tax=Pleionea sp. CnH1-48 TaxID=2954494 RepID=UPI0020979EE6|nr:cytochrome c peroxidase [Pleionea sp. CnH1-48]MCO7223344.1 c-type cytochrome [Pleionea sp. CnH1-48]